MNGLSDYPFKGVVDWMYGQIGNDFKQACMEVLNRLNYNKGVKCYPIIVSNDCFSSEEVEKIIAVYDNSALDGSSPEYNRDEQPENIEMVERKVSELSGVELLRVKTCLYTAYYAAKDGGIKNSDIIFPKTANKYAAYRIEPEVGSKDPITNLLEIMKWTALIAGIGIVGYLILKYID